jgi:hypothetical protein
MGKHADISDFELSELQRAVHNANSRIETLNADNPNEIQEIEFLVNWLESIVIRLQEPEIKFRTHANLSLVR